MAQGLRSHYKVVTLTTAGTIVNGPHTMPATILFSGDTDLAARARADGADIVVTLDDGITIVPFDRVYWNNITGDLHLEVLLTLTSGVNLDLIVWYGGGIATPSNDREDRPGVWGPGSYTMVYFPGAGNEDHSGNFGDITPVGSPTTGFDPNFGVYARTVRNDGDGYDVPFGVTPATNFLTFEEISSVTDVSLAADTRVYTKQSSGAEQDHDIMIGYQQLGGSQTRIRARLRTVDQNLTITLVAPWNTSNDTAYYSALRYNSGLPGGSRQGELWADDRSTGGFALYDSDLQVGGVVANRGGFSPEICKANGANYHDGKVWSLIGAESYRDPDYMQSAYQTKLNQTASFVSIGAEQANPAFGKQFKIQSLTAIIPESAFSITLTEGVDYTLDVTDPTRVFCRLVSSRNTSVGRTSGGGFQGGDYTSAIVDQSNIFDSVTVSRVSDPAGWDDRFVIQFVEYLGAPGGPDEIIVRQVGQVTIGTTVDAVTTAIPGATDTAKSVPLVTGQRCDCPTAGDTPGGYVTSDFLAGPLAEFRRGDGWGPNDNDTTDVSYAIVEFTGSNWSVSRQTFEPNQIGGQNITVPIYLPNHTFLHYQYRVDHNNNNVNEAGGAVRFVGAITININMVALPPAGEFEFVLWFVQSTNLTSNTYQFFDQIGSGAGSEEQVIDWTLPGPPNTEFIEGRLSVEGCSSNATGVTTAHPRGNIAFQLREDPGVGSDVVLTTRQMDNGSTSDIAAHVFTWPEVFEDTLAGQIDGVATVTGDVGVETVLNATVVGQSTVTGTINQTRELDAAVTGQSTVTGELPVNVPVEALVQGVSTVAGELLETDTLQAVVTGVATVDGALAVTAELAAQVTGVSTVVGSLGLSVPLAGSVTGASTVTADLTIDESAVIYLEALVAGVATVSGDVSVSVDMQAGVAGAATVSADLDSDTPLVATVAGQSTVSADLLTSVDLNATINGVATMEGMLIEEGQLTANVTGQSTVAADLALNVPLELTVNGVSTVSGTMNLSAPFTAVVNGQSTVSGTLLDFDEMTAVVTGQSTVAGDLALDVDIEGLVVGQSTVTGGLFSEIPMDAVVSGQATVEGVLDQLTRLQGLVTGQSTVAGTLLSADSLNALVSGVSTIQGDMGVNVDVASVVAGQATVAGDIGIARALEAVVNGVSVVTGQSTTNLQMSTVVTGQSTVEGSITDVRMDVQSDGVGGMFGTLNVLFSTEGQVRGRARVAGSLTLIQLEGRVGEPNFDIVGGAEVPGGIELTGRTRKQ